VADEHYQYHKKGMYIGSSCSSEKMHIQLQ